MPDCSTEPRIKPWCAPDEFIWRLFEQNNENYPHLRYDKIKRIWAIEEDNKKKSAREQQNTCPDSLLRRDLQWLGILRNDGTLHSLAAETIARIEATNDLVFHTIFPTAPHQVAA